MTDKGKSTLHIAVIGNPNSGKTTVFNQLTGLRQKTGNFPGITVELQRGPLRLPSGRSAALIDFPGAYSLYANSSDEKIVTTVLSDATNPAYPDAVLYVADSMHLEKHLLLFTQLLDLGLPVVLALNMTDTASEQGLRIDHKKLSAMFNVPVLPISGRSGMNIPQLLQELEGLLDTPPSAGHKLFYTPTEQEKQIADAVSQNLDEPNLYRALQLVHHYSWLPFLSDAHRLTIKTIVDTKSFVPLRCQIDETLSRYDLITPIVQQVVQKPIGDPEKTTDKIDAVVTHKFWGPFLFFLIMLMVFQAIFDWSSYPMDMIEEGFARLNDLLKGTLPQHWSTDLLTEGIISGLSGILIFIPQIALLFFLVSVLEEVGYMARVVFMFDKSMRRYGMNGRSIVALISGGACAVPAIMSARTIGNWHERLITVMVTPFISCSARLPVYAVLIGLAVPEYHVFGFINIQGLTFASMYLLGVLAALGSGWLLKKYLKTRELSFLALELPVYRVPHWKNVWLTVWEKTMAFVWGAGKIILIISVILWFLASYGPPGAMNVATATAEAVANEQLLNEEDKESLTSSYKLEASWAGHLGKFIEPAIRPLGYDWKIGIALITSFAAREVFVGTMSTIYSIGTTDDYERLRKKMENARYADNGQPVYTLATAISLLIFYALAMQCMSTLAVVKRETGSWKWAAFQFFFMSGLAYLLAWVAYITFS
jgi:ferrous iron transport protein B